MRTVAHDGAISNQHMRSNSHRRNADVAANVHEGPESKGGMRRGAVGLDDRGWLHDRCSSNHAMMPELQPVSAVGRIVACSMSCGVRREPEQRMRQK